MCEFNIVYDKSGGRVKRINDKKNLIYRID